MKNNFWNKIALILCGLTWIVLMYQAYQYGKSAAEREKQLSESLQK